MEINYLAGLDSNSTNAFAVGYEAAGNHLEGLIKTTEGYKTPSAMDDLYPTAKESNTVVKAIVAPGPLKGSDDFAHLSDNIAKQLAPLVRHRESTNNYRAVNSGGYIGAYQQGAAMLIDLGVVKKGTKNRDLNNPDVWLRYNKEEYLNNPELQDKLFEEEIKLNRRYLKGSYKNTEDLYGMLVAAHLLGAGGAKARGKDGKTDANGTTFEEYYNIGVSGFTK